MGRVHPAHLQLFTCYNPSAISKPDFRFTLLRWHSWIARPPPKGQVAGSNPARGTKISISSHLSFDADYKIHAHQ